MRKGFYARMALNNLKGNHRVFVPYLLTCMGTVMMFYILCALAYGNMIGGQLAFGEETLKAILYLGIYVVGLFSVIFLFYTNSFLTKRRKKEFGLYNILGMEKRHIARVMLYETCYTMGAALVAGLAGGILLSKLMALFVLRLLRVDGGAAFQVCTQALAITCALFGVIFLLIYLSALATVHLSSPAELLRGGQVGEKEPKTRWLLTLAGLLLLGGGYYIAVVTTNPADALLLFFVAVILVILGTYCLFVAGSVALLKTLRKNKGYYYQTRHFIAVSGMIYRMKQNAVGLANICILSTMVLVMLSSTISLYAGVKDAVDKDLPGQITLSSVVGEGADLEAMKAQSKALLDEAGLTPTREVGLHCLPVMARSENGQFVANPADNRDGAKVLCFVSQDDVPQAMNGVRLEPGQALVQKGAGYKGDSLTAFGLRLDVVGEGQMDFVSRQMAGPYSDERLTVVVAGQGAINAIDQAQRTLYGDRASQMLAIYAFDLDAGDEAQCALAQRLNERMADVSAVSAAQLCIDAYKLYGSLFFLGLFLGALFIMAAVLIMYYKQMSEGYDDRRRFQIMRGVGLDQQQIKRTIKSQVLTVFFLPLAMAALHIAFAFPMIVRMFSVLTLTNVPLFALTTLGALALFGLFYAAVYALTARTYYRIVLGDQSLATPH